MYSNVKIRTCFFCAFEDVLGGIRRQQNGTSKGRQGGVIELVFLMDKDMLEALPTFLNSLLSSTRRKVHFHVIWCERDSVMLKEFLSCFDIKKLDFHFIDVRENAKRYISPIFWRYLNYTTKYHESIARCSNIIRLQTHKIVPHLDRVLFLDVDTIVQG